MGDVLMTVVVIVLAIEATGHRPDPSGQTRRTGQRRDTPTTSVAPSASGLGASGHRRAFRQYD